MYIRQAKNGSYLFQILRIALETDKPCLAKNIYTEHKEQKEPCATYSNFTDWDGSKNDDERNNGT